ncbi:derlin-1 [Seriola lalandi dorsalis]|uniref:Derlin n=1 Tax=Seriola lalandi dorsalis TaxID=1841481 RepID=A0A3B4XYZ8_SERLL|nr:derlin-1 [Seriola lalandi dorsalis]XP_056236402.1 derlin-1 [Seriola aureovittata]
MSDIGDWFRSIPLITRSWFAASIAVPFIGKLGLVDFRHLMLVPELVYNKFHLWRPVTATLYFPITPNTGFLYLVNLYFLYHYSSRLETGAFDGRPADYIFMLLFNWICIVITGMLMNMRLLMIPLIMSVLYVWAQFNKDMIVSFWFGTRFKAHYLPWVILVFNFIIGGSFVNELTGNLVGHLYFFLMFKYPMDLGGRSFLSTPEFLYRYFPNKRGGVSGFGVPPSRRPAAQEQAGGGGGGGGGGGRHNWGQGFRLGGE